MIVWNGRVVRLCENDLYSCTTPINTFIYWQVNHIVSNGIPVMIADRVSTKNAIDFIQNVESAVNAASSYSASPAGRGHGHTGDDNASIHSQCVASAA